MTAPTQAQIEAATEAIYQKATALNPPIDGFPISKIRCRKYAEAALIAAAEVKPQIDPNIVYPGKDNDFTFPEE